MLRRLRPKKNESLSSGYPKTRNELLRENIEKIREIREEFLRRRPEDQAAKETQK